MTPKNSVTVFLYSLRDPAILDAFGIQQSATIWSPMDTPPYRSHDIGLPSGRVIRHMALQKVVST
jgi:hypothetical protein